MTVAAILLAYAAGAGTLGARLLARAAALSQLIGACVLRLRATYATPGGASAARLADPPTTTSSPCDARRIPVCS